MVWSVSITAGVVLLFGLVGPLIPCKRVACWVCPVSGSTKTQVTWFGCFSQNERTVSALERWLRRTDPSFEPQWQHISTTTYYVQGRSYACGKAPEIYQLMTILDGLVAKLSDERIADLVKVLRHGSPDERREAVRKIADDYFDTD